MNNISNEPLEAGKRSPAGIASWNRVLFEDLIQQSKACSDAARWEEMLQWNSVASWFA